MVRDHPTSTPVKATAWLSAKRGESRKLRAGLVETTAKARTLAFADASDGWTVTFDAELANGRDVDILLSGPERSYYIECTVITESDEDQQVHDEWLEARKSTPGLLLARPGPFDSPNAKGPSPLLRRQSLLHQGVRQAAKKRQSSAEPNEPGLPEHPPAVLLSGPQRTAAVFTRTGWTLDELFSGQPNMGAVKQMPPGSSLPDISSGPR
jgi:hypothetical protein